MNIVGTITPRHHVFPASVAHIREMAEIMRAEDRAEAVGLGGDPHTLLHASYRASLWAMAATVNHQLAAVWGLNGSPMARVGTPWLITAPAMDKATPRLCLRIGSQQVESMLELRPRLENVVDGRYTRAIRFLKLLGFHVESAEPYPGTGVPFCKFWIDRDLGG